jgi:hypothetical protein
MFGLIRKTLTLVVVAASSIALWESGMLSDVATKTVPSAAEKMAMAQSATEQRPESGSAPQTAENMPTEKVEEGMSTGQRLVVWVLFVLLLPVLTAPLAGHIMDRESNAANVLMLFGYTGLDVLSAHVVNLLHVSGIVSAIFFLIGLLAVFAYNLWVCGFVAGLRR